MEYLRKSMGDEVDFLPANKHETFLQIDSITLGVHSQASQGTQYNKPSISLRYHKEKVKGDIDFLPADKHQRFLQIETITLSAHSRTYQNYQK